MRNAFAGAFLLGWLLVGPGVAQDSPFSRKKLEKKEEAKDGSMEPPKPVSPVKGLPQEKNYDKALDYIQGHYAQKRDWRTVPEMLAGLAFFLDGREKYYNDLEKCIAIAKLKILDEKMFNRNWFVAYAALFLAIVHLHEPREDLKEALEKGLEVAERGREDDTLGWGHNKGWGRSSGYYKRGGAVDLGIVTATMYSAFAIAKKGGIEVPQSFFDRTLKNLHSISPGGVVAYGTENRWGGFISRSSAAFPGLHVLRQTSDKIYKAVARQLPQETKRTEKGHAWGPSHFLANAVAAKILGKYPAYANYWLPVLGGRQESDGATRMNHDGKADSERTGQRHGATSVYAIMILLQKKELVPRTFKKKKKPKAGGPSPFHRKIPKFKEEDLPTGGPTGPNTGNK